MRAVRSNIRDGVNAWPKRSGLTNRNGRIELMSACWWLIVVCASVSR